MRSHRTLVIMYVITQNTNAFVCDPTEHLSVHRWQHRTFVHLYVITHNVWVWMWSHRTLVGSYVITLGTWLCMWHVHLNLWWFMWHWPGLQILVCDWQNMFYIGWCKQPTVVIRFVTKAVYETKQQYRLSDTKTNCMNVTKRYLWDNSLYWWRLSECHSSWG